MKRFSIVIVLVAAMTLVFAGTAAANFGPHGGYLDDTDACAGCHRAHSSFSPIKYTPRIGGDLLAEEDKPSALLVGSATTITEFCNACHGDLAPGASTNVVSGLFDGGPSAQTTVTVGDMNGGVVTLYQTASTALAPLNGGGFVESANLVDWEANGAAAYQPVTSTHDMDATGVLWGDGNAADRTMNLTCTSCHDPHGSSNYRLLKDSVNGRTVGGYSGGLPDAFVYSVETGYDDVYATNGWLKSATGAAQMDAYRPDYTSGSTDIRSGTLGKSLSAWCAACHWQYDQKSGTKADPIAGTYDYLSYEGGVQTVVGPEYRHRHPVDMPLTAGDANLQVLAQELADVDGLDPYIPLEVNPGVGSARQNQVGCLTCHFAHGGAAEMTGWSNAVLQEIDGVWAPVLDATQTGVQPARGTAPTSGSALLRANDRGVCQRCHDK